jgi:hypothetical protein
MTFLELSQVEHGVDELLWVIPNLESHRPPIRPEGRSFTFTASRMHDGVAFSIRVSCKSPSLLLPHPEFIVPDRAVTLVYTCAGTGAMNMETRGGS